MSPLIGQIKGSIARQGLGGPAWPDGRAVYAKQSLSAPCREGEGIKVAGVVAGRPTRPFLRFTSFFIPPFDPTIVETVVQLPHNFAF